MTLVRADWMSVLPAVGVIATAFLVVLVDLFLPRDRSKTPLDALSLLGLSGSAAALFHRIYARVAVRGFRGSVVLDDLAVVLSLAVLAAAALLILLSSEDIRRRKINLGEFHGLVLISAAAMMLLVQSTNLIMIFLMIETLSLGVYVLTGITRLQPRAGEAAMKYFVTGSFASGFLLYGMTLLYGATGTIHLGEMAAKLSGPSPLALVGVGLMMVGFAFKIGAVPFHMWVPDVYEGAPTSVTAFMSTSVKAAGFGALVRVLLTALPGQSAEWGDLLWGLAAATMVVGNLMAVPQRSVKRMLAYSSVAHSGYVLLGLAALKGGGGSVGSAAVFYVFIYTFMTFGAFAALVYFGREVTFPGRSAPEWHDAEDLFDLAGAAKKRPWAAAAMTIFMVSLAGIPPTAGFAGKFLLFKAAIENGYYILAVLGILMSIVSVYYYLRVVVYMYMKDPLEELPETSDANVGVAVATATLMTLVLGLVPGTIYDLCVRAMATVRP